MTQEIKKVIIQHEGGNKTDLTPKQIETFEGPWIRRVGKDNISHVSLTNHDTDLVPKEGYHEVIIHHSI